MKKILITSLILLGAIFSLSTYAKANEQSLDQIVAIVNEDVVSKSELNHALAVAKLQLAQGNLATPSEAALQKQVLDQLINKKLQLQIAKQAGIQITYADLDQAIERIAKQNNMTVSALYQRLNQDGMSTAEYREEIREQLALHKLQQQEVIGRIIISPEEVTRFIRSKAWQANGLKEYHLEDILIPLSDTPSSEDIINAKKRAQAVLTKLNQGQNFSDITLSEPNDKNALQAGDLGWRKLPEIPSAFAEQVARMKQKEVAGPIQASNGFHIIRLIEVRAANASQATPSRKQIEQLLLQRKFEETLQTWVSKLRGQAFIVTNPDK